MWSPWSPDAISDSAIELCLTLKTLFNLPLRQVTGLVASLIKMADLDWPVPDYTTLCRRQKTLKVNLVGRANSGGLHLLVDSTGIKMTGEGEWKTRKHGASYRLQWRKVQLGIDAGTLDIRAMPPSQNTVPTRSSRSAATADHGRKMAPALMRAMKRYA